MDQVDVYNRMTKETDRDVDQSLFDFKKKILDVLDTSENFPTNVKNGYISHLNSFVSKKSKENKKHENSKRE